MFGLRRFAKQRGLRALLPVLSALMLVVLALASLPLGGSDAVLAQASGEQTSKFLPEDIDFYASFDLDSSHYDRLEEVFDVFLEDVVVWAVRELVLDEVIEERWGIDYEEDVKPWLDDELAVATLRALDDGAIFFIGTSDEDATQDALDLWLSGLVVTTEDYGGVTIAKVTRTLDSGDKDEYYAITGGYLLAAVGGVALVDFKKDVIDSIPGGWSDGDSLWDNADFQDVRSTLPAHFGLAYVNAENLPEDAADFLDALGPYWPYVSSLYDILAEDMGGYLGIEIPGFDDLYDGLAPMAALAYDFILQYDLPYIGVSLAVPSDDRVHVDFYSPAGDLPFDPGEQNPLETSQFAPYDAVWFVSDVNLDAWWRELYPMLGAESGEIDQALDDLEAMGLLDELEDLLGFDPRWIVDFVEHTDIDENTFDWAEAEFAWARLPDEDGEGQLFVFEVTDETALAGKMADIAGALDDIGISGIEGQRDGDYLIVAYPSGVLDDALGRSALQGQSRYHTLLSYLPDDRRGVVYFDADRLEDYVLPDHGLLTTVAQSFMGPLTNGGLSYFVGNPALTGRFVLRLYAPAEPPPSPPSSDKEPECVCSDLEISPEEVYPGEEVDISVEVENVGDARGTCTVKLRIDGDVEETERVVLRSDQSKTVRFTVTRDEPGKYKVEVCGLKGSFTVEPGFDISGLRISASQVSPGEDVTISVEVENLGEAKGSYSVRLRINGELEESEEVTVAGGKTEEVSFVVSRGEPGEYEVSVNGLEGKFSVVVEAAAFAVSDLRVAPDRVSPDEQVSISVLVANIGNVEGSYSMTLKINGVVEETKIVTLAIGASQRPSFAASRSEPGTYEADIGGLKGSFVVEEGAVVPPGPWIHRYWWVIVIAALGVVLLALTLMLLRKRSVR